MNTSLKTCFKCGGEKSRTEFYRHPEMGDGLLGKCKECTKLDARLRLSKPEVRARTKEYDRLREQRPERKAQKMETQRRRRLRDPVKARANYLATNAIRDGRLIRKPCEVCGDAKSQAHHSDYSKPLAVRWLCFKHHRAVHGQRIREEEPAYAV